MSLFGALNFDLVSSRTLGSAHPQGDMNDHGNKEKQAKELQYQSLLDRDVRYSPAPKRVQAVLNAELSVSLSQLSQVSQPSQVSQFKIVSSGYVSRAGADDVDRVQGRSLSPDTVEEGVDLEAVAANVMQLVTDRLNSAQAQGESEETLHELAEQAKRGISVGIAEASAVLDRMRIFNEGLETRLTQLNETLDERIDQHMEQRSDQRSDQRIEGTLIESVPEVSKVEKVVEKVEKVHRPIESAYTRYDAHQREDQFSLNVMTQEGDQITLAVSQGYRYEASQGIDFQGRLSQSSHLSFHVNGHINADEQRALEALFSQVNEMADQFYSGDVASAFEHAMNLRMDTRELSAMHLNMSSRQVTQMQETYRQVAHPTERLMPESERGGVASLLDYLDQVSRKAAWLNEHSALSHLGEHLRQLLPEAVASHPKNERDMMTPEDIGRLIGS